jgi:glycosyltransferase involved in cell wall biosynthesis
VAAGKRLRIAWLGGTPLDTGGVPGVVAELLEGLTALGHEIDCFFPGSGGRVPARLRERERLTFIWGMTGWSWNRWYSRSGMTATISGQIARIHGALRLRGEIVRRHRARPYDVIYQISTIEAPGAPARLARSVPLVICPQTHMAGELRCLIAERRLVFATQPRHVFFTSLALMSIRALVQRVRIKRARLLICISSVFRDHLVRDYRFPSSATTVIPNPVRLERFTPRERAVGTPPMVLVLGFVALRKGVEDVVALAHELLSRGLDARIRVVGGPRLWSDYTKLLEDLPGENAEYVGRVEPPGIPAELAAGDVLLQPSKYEPFGLTVAEALASGLSVIGTSEVGAIENVDPQVAAVVAPGDVAAMATAVETLLARLREDPRHMRRTARAEAERLFARDVVCAQLSAALQRLVDPEHAVEPAGPPATSSRSPA